MFYEKWVYMTYFKALGGLNLLVYSFPLRGTPLSNIIWALILLMD